MVKQQGKDMYKQAEYGSLIGALLFVAVSTRPDVAFAVGLLTRFVSKPSVEHWNAAENVLLYLKGTKDRGILLGGKTNKRDIVGYADSDWASDSDDRISVSGGVVF
jgi:hypothetical protein